MHRLYRLSLMCGVAPLVVGTCVFLLWWLVRWDALMTVGMLTMLGGTIAFVVGVVCLAVYLRRAARMHAYPVKRLVVQGLLAGGLLLANFPAAAGMAVFAFHEKTKYAILLVNDSPEPLERFAVSISHSHQTVECGPVPPHTSARRSFSVWSEGELRYRALQHGQQIEGVIDGYVTPHVGGDKTIVVTPRLHVTVKDNRKG